MEVNEITGIIIEEAIKIHKDLGPGLLESVYEEILSYRLKQKRTACKKTNINSCLLRRNKNGGGF
jgi:GxxExxY protein